MSSKSSSDRDLLIGRVLGHRGAQGALTLRIASGEAGRWTGLKRLFLGPSPEADPPSRREYEVLEARAYRDRLVVRLEGVTGPGEAAALRGAWVFAGRDELPELEEGETFVAWLLGLEAREPSGRPVGRVTDWVDTPAGGLLVLESAEGEEILVPWHRDLVPEVHEDQGWLVVRLPQGLRDINRPPGRARDRGGES